MMQDQIDRISEWRNIAVKHISKGDIYNAMQVLRHILGTDPSLGDIWMRLGICLYAVGNHGDAFYCLTQASFCKIDEKTSHTIEKYLNKVSGKLHRFFAS